MARSICIALLIFISVSFACWGARPLSMGGAFVAVADDVNAIYWNPAGLGKLRGGDATAVKNIGGVNDYNYDLYLASGIYDDKNNFGYAGAYVADTTELSAPFVASDPDGEETDIGRHELQTTYMQLGFGKKFDIFNLPGDLYYGANIKQMNFKYLIRYNKPSHYDLIFSPIEDKVIEYDLGLLYDFGPQVSSQNRLFSIGVLGQNLSSAKTDELQSDYVSNVRPGIAIRPDKTWTISAEWYNINGDGKKGSDTKDLRLGLEKKLFDDHLALRYGIYHENNEDMKAYTYGLALTWFDLSAEYTCMDWVKNAPGEDSRSIMFGISYKVGKLPD